MKYAISFIQYNFIYHHQNLLTMKNQDLTTLSIFMQIKEIEENIKTMQNNINKLYNELSDLDDIIENQNNLIKTDSITLTKSQYHKIIIHYLTNYYNEITIQRDIENHFDSDWISDESFNINYHNTIVLDSCNLDLSNFDIQNSLLEHIEINDEYINIDLTEEE